MLSAKKLGARILHLRRSAKLTQREIAQKCFLSPQAISKWEKGTSTPDILILDDLAEALGVEIKDLFEDSEESPQDKQ